MVWLGAIVVSVPGSFAGAYFLVANKRFRSSWQRVILGALLGFILAPVVFLAAYLLPLTLWVVIPLTFICALARAFIGRRRNRIRA